VRATWSERAYYIENAMRILAFLFLLAACSRPDAGVTDGSALFDQTCARCHGRDGHGDPVAKVQLGVPDMTDRAWQARHTDEDIVRTVHEGSKSKKMPPFGDVYSPTQLDAIVAHVRSFGR
jgi:mono/diheme cytochrome c family protein